MVVGGLALVFLGFGLTGLIGKDYVQEPAERDDPALGHPAGSPTSRFWGEAFFQQLSISYLAFLFPVAAMFLLYRTQHGLNMRSIGEDPGAADATGLSVNGWRIFYVAVGGAFAGLGGAVLTPRHRRHLASEHHRRPGLDRARRRHLRELAAAAADRRRAAVRRPRHLRQRRPGRGLVDHPGVLHRPALRRHPAHGLPDWRCCGSGAAAARRGRRRWACPSSVAPTDEMCRDACQERSPSSPARPGDRAPPRPSSSAARARASSLADVLDDDGEAHAEALRVRRRRGDLPPPRRLGRPSTGTRRSAPPRPSSARSTCSSTTPASSASPASPTAPRTSGPRWWASTRPASSSACARPRRACAAPAPARSSTSPRSSRSTRVPGYFAYQASKAAVVQMTRAAAVDLAPHGIRVNCILPGLIFTPMTETEPEEMVAANIEQTPLGRGGEPEEVASGVALPGLGRGVVRDRRRAPDRRRLHGAVEEERWRTTATAHAATGSRTRFPGPTAPAAPPRSASTSTSTACSASPTGRRRRRSSRPCPGSDTRRWRCRAWSASTRRWG